jgi:SNF2 family DNA or RNA helicase
MFFYYNININSDKIKANNSFIAGKIKDEINFDELIENPKLYNVFKNDEAKQSLLDMGMNISWVYKPSIRELFDLYTTKYIKIEDEIKFSISIVFFKLIKPELFSPELVLKNIDFKTIVHRHFVIDNNQTQNEFHQYRISLFCKTLEKNRILDLRFTQPKFMKTTLFPYQRDSIKWIQEQETDLKSIHISNDKIMHLPCNLIYNHSSNEIIPEEAIPKYIIRGGIIADDLGVGKTIQILTVIMSTPEISTLILCPDHIKHHWLSEIDKHFIMSNCHSNFIILTFSEFLGNLKDMVLSNFDRIVIDELHELYDENKKSNESIFNKLLQYDFKYRWGLSATPFISNKSLFKLMQFLCNNQENKLFSEMPAHYRLNQINMMRFFRRNMKENILLLPDIKINDVFINFSQFERTIYESELSAKTSNVDTLFLRKLCSDIMTSLGLETSQTITPDELKAQVMQKFQSKYINAVRVYDELHEKINNIEREKQILLCLDVNLHAYKIKLQEQGEIVKSRKRVIDRYVATIDNITEIIRKRKATKTETAETETAETETETETETTEEDLCGICLGEYDDTLTYLEICGHYFCKTCFDSFIKSTHTDKCPFCRNTFHKTNLKTISNSVAQTMSTKTKEIIKIIKSSQSEQFVIFTQFHSLISNIQITLSRHSIQCTTLKEYLETKKTSQILLLSSEENASGLDLSFIRNVIIIEPFENYNYGKEIEKQLIGRLHRINQTQEVNVFRMIIRNSIEEEIYSRM